MQNSIKTISKTYFELFVSNSIKKLKIKNLNICFKLSQLNSILCLLVILLLQFKSITAQQAYTPNAAKPGSYAGSSGLTNFETINPYSGNMNFNLPLLGVGGRGSANSQISLAINQKYMVKSWSWVDDPFQNWYAQDYATDTYTSFTNGYSPGLLLIDSIGFQETFCPYNAGYYQYQQTLTKVRFIAPDGTEYNFRDRLTNGQPLNSSLCTLGVPQRGNVFDAADGSSATFISDTLIGDNIFPGGPTTYTHGNGYVILGNGTRYRIELGVVVWQEDKNGNRVSYSYTRDSYNRIAVSQISDSLNRIITFEYGVQDVAPYGLSDRITYKGFNEETKVIRVSYRNLGDILRTGYSLQTRGQLFPDIYTEACHPGETAGSCASYITNPEKPSAVWLPDGRSYKFQYNSYAELARVELPTGSAVEYDWINGFSTGSGKPRGMVPPGNNAIPGIYRRLTERRLYSDGITLDSKLKIEGTEYITANQGYVIEEHYGSNNNLIGKTKHYYYGIDQSPVVPLSALYYESWQNGREYRTDFYANDGNTVLHRQLNTWENRFVPWTTDQQFAPTYDTKSTKQVSIAIENGAALAVLKKTEYDEAGSSDPGHFSHLNVKKSKAYNYKVLDLNTAQNGTIETISAMFSESDLASVSETDYLYNEGYKQRHIIGLPFETRVMDPNNPTQVLTKSQVVFDEQNQYYSMLDLGSTVGYETPTGTYAHLRANATTHRTWFAEENRWIETHTQYDNFGNMRKAWDSSGDPNRFVETEYSPQYYYAYPTRKIIKAPGDGIQGTTENSDVEAVYDFWTGLITSAIDDNGQITTTEYDARLRPKKVIPPSGGGITEKIYGDTPGNFFVKTRTQVDAQNWAESIAYMDNLGRVFKTQTKDVQGDVFSEVEYDSFGRVKRVSSPYRQGEQKYWSQPRYDNAGRVVESYAPAPDGLTGLSLGTVEFGISDISGMIGSYVTATDASGRKSRSFTNVYGQTVRVDEPTGNNDLGALDNPNQPSYYSYNVKGELVKIKQGKQNETCGTTAQCRYFMYDSLGRLTRVRQPEQIPHTNLATAGNPENNQWTSGFTYDVFGNVTTVTDAKGMTITNVYDKAGRVTKSSYNDNVTPEVNYFYDGKGLPQVPQFAKGNITKISNGISDTKYTSFDSYGRVLTNQQFTDGRAFDFQYKYDSVGNLIEETYPSGRVVKTLLDTDGGITAISSKLANSPFKTYASSFNYSATGNVKAMMLGNGRWETASFNERQQLIQIGLGNNASDTSLWKVNYDYGELNTDGSVNGNKNTGMIAKQTISLPTNLFVQTYKYDALNRLTEAKENAETVTGTENWKQTFDYDRYGNRTNFYQKVGNNVLPASNITKPQIDPATNRFTTGQGYIYDFNGNLIQDAENREFTYDGDDKQTVVRNLNIPTTPQNLDANVIGRYYYDGEGKRVKKITNLETTIFVYDAAGALVAEYSTQTNQNPTTSYLTTDTLGSPRVITDKNGNVVSRRDFMPFGEEILAGVGARDVNMKYSASGIDNVRQSFTGYEKDIETDLDFAQARMYKNSHGRFTAPDPLLASASIANPQTFNRYAYVGNNPVNLTDPSGLAWCNVKGIATYKGENVLCENPEDTVTTATALYDGFDSYGREIRQGETATLLDNGTFTVNRPLEQQEVAQFRATGETVQAESNPVEMTNSFPGTAIDLLPLPCPDPENCNTSMILPPERLDTKNVEPLETVRLLEDISRAGAILPAVGVPFTIIKVAIDVGQGDFQEAGGNALSIIPGGRIFTIADRLSEMKNLIDSRRQNRPEDVHANSHQTNKPTELYTLRDRGDDSVKKIGETTQGDGRYNKKELKEKNVYRKVEAIGTKAEMYRAQTLWIRLFKKKNGARPPLNRSDY